MNLKQRLFNYRYRKQLDLHEISQYRQDLERITLLRDKSPEDSELRKEYDNVIMNMVKVLEFLTSRKGRK